MEHMEGKRFFCLRGFMKSGTNWLGSLLENHPHVSCQGEYHWQEIIGPLHSRNTKSSIRLDDGFRRHAIARFEGAVKRSMLFGVKPGAVVIGDRTPHTLAPLILRHSPHISIIRDGRDIVVSRAFHLFNNPQISRLFQRSQEAAADLAEFQQDPWFFSKHPQRLLRHEEIIRDTARWWREHLEQDRRTVETHRRLSVRFVKYEDLHQRTGELTNQLLQFLEVDPELAPPLSGKLLPGFEQERPNEFYRKGAIGDWQNYFDQQAKQWFKEEARDELKTQGYEESDDW